jgi:hypothetical protein
MGINSLLIGTIKLPLRQMPYSLSKTSRCQFDGVRFQTPIVRIRTYLDWEKASASGCFGARDFLTSNIVK